MAQTQIPPTDLIQERDYWRRQAEALATEVEELRFRTQSLAGERPSDPLTLAELAPPEPAGMSSGPHGSSGPQRAIDTMLRSGPIDHLSQWLGKASLTTLRVSLGLVFFGFGLLKFFPDVSPAEDISQRTVDALTFGLISGDAARILVAVFEVVVGLCLITGRFLRLGLALLVIASVGILSPLVLFPDELFGRPNYAPTLLGQYVLKDIVLLAAGMVVVARVLAEDVRAAKAA